MSLKERVNEIKTGFNHFWNVTLGTDIEEEVQLDDTLVASLKEIDSKVERFENSNKSTSTKKGGKAGKGSVVEKAEVDTSKAAEKAEQKSAESKTKDDGNEIGDR